METIGKIASVIFLMISSAIIMGFVLLKYWSWFLIPIFNLKEIRLVECIGILLLISFIRMKKSNTESEDAVKEMFENFIYIVAYSGLAWLFGWITQLFM